MGLHVTLLPSQLIIRSSAGTWFRLALVAHAHGHADTDAEKKEKNCLDISRAIILSHNFLSKTYHLYK